MYNNNVLNKSEKTEDTVVKRNSILRPDLHRQISELLDQDYYISPDKIITKITPITMERIDRVDNPTYKTKIYTDPSLGIEDILPLKIVNHKITNSIDTGIQTDLSFNDIKVKNDLNRVLAEVETLGFFYMTEEERLEQLRILLSDDYDSYKPSYDPCIEFEKYSREVESDSNPKYRARHSSRSRSKSSHPELTRSVSSQTFLISLPNHKSTQTTPDIGSPTDSSDSTPVHKLVTAKTTTVIKKDPNDNDINKIRERFSIKNERDNSLEYTQSSEYKTDKDKVEKLSSNLDIKDKHNNDNKNDNSNSKLAHSTIEMTSVIDNKTTVTGIPIKDSNEKFTIQVINPRDKSAERDSVNKIPVIPTLTDIEISSLEPKKSQPAVLVKNNLDLENYEFSPNNQRKFKQKPYIIECEDPVVQMSEKSPSTSSKSSHPEVSPRQSIKESPKLLVFNEEKNKTQPNVSDMMKKKLLEKENLNISNSSINEYSIKSIPNKFKPNLNLAQSNPSLNTNNLFVSSTNSSPRILTKKADNNENNQFTISQIPKMFRYDLEKDLNINNINKKEPLSKLELSESLKMRLNQNDMIMLNNNQPTFKQQLTNPKSVSSKELNSNNHSPSIKPRIQNLDYNKSENEIIEVDFDSYNTPTFKQVIKEIEVAADELPEIKTKNLNNTKIEKRVNFRAEPTILKPQIKDRVSSILKKENLDIDLSAYEENKNYVNQDASRVKILNDLNEVDNSKMVNELEFRVISQAPFIQNLKQEQKKLSISLEKLEINENFDQDSNQGFFEVTCVDPKNFHKAKPELNSINKASEANKPLTKLEKIIIENIEKEYLKALNRQNYRKERVPELLKEFKEKSLKDGKKLEKELNVLMRKFNLDDELIKQYESDESALDLINKARIKKKKRSQSNDDSNLELSDFESSPIFKHNEARYVKNIVNKKQVKNDKYSNKSLNKPFESGYSSLEDSLLDFKTSSENEATIKRQNENVIPIPNPRAQNKPINSESNVGKKVPSNENNDQRSNYKSPGSNNTSPSNNPTASVTSRETSSLNSNPNNNQNDDDEDDEKRKKKNIDNFNRNVNTQEPGKQEINYIEEEDLENLDNLANFGYYVDETSGETVLIDLQTNENFIVLPKNWRRAENSFYFAEEDVDLNGLKVYLDEKTNRRFLLDDENNNRYYIVSAKSIKKYSKNLGLSQNSNNKQQDIKDSDQVIQLKHETEQEKSNQEIENNYVEEHEIENLNIEDMSFFQDESSGEILFVDPNNMNQRWILIPNDWRTVENLPYVSEDDVNQVKIDVYEDPVSKRKYVIDEKSGQRYFVIPKFRKDIRNFMRSKLEQDSAKSNSLNTELNKPKIHQDQTSQKNQKKTENEPKLVIGDEKIENLENEPSNLKLRQSEAKSAIKNRYEPNLPNSFNNRFTPKNNENRLIIKQPGKPGHLIRDNNNKTNLNKPNQTQIKPQNQNEKSKTPDNKNRVPTKTEQARKLVLAKMKQDAARQAFFQQKLPDVGKLWLHQLLIEQTNRNKRNENLIKGFQSIENLSDDLDPNRYLDENGKPKSWKSLNHLTDPTADGDKLDRDRLLEIQIYGYDKFNKTKKKRNMLDDDENIDHQKGKNYQPPYDPNNSSFGGFRSYDYIRGILSEDFVESKDYRPLQLNRYYRALYPYTRLNLRQQFLTTPRYLKTTWQDVLSQSNKMQPKLIIINDDELILTKNKNCNVYVQYEYKKDAVLGADRAYQLMLPERGPTQPARPLMISPARLNKALALRPEKELREAPVFVYHENGNAFYENLAQYLAGKQAKLSPKTARKILQFADLKEFEDYLAAKLTREEAKRLARLSGEDIINIDSVQKELSNIIRDRTDTNGQPAFYHINCEYDPLRPYDRKGLELEESNEYEIAGTKMKSTFIGFGNDGEAKRVKISDLPNNLLNVMREALITDSKVNNN